MIVYEPTARVILTQGPCVLVATCHGENFSILIGGHIEKDDDVHALAGLRREVMEEVGVTLSAVTKLAVLPNTWMRNGDTVHEIMHLYAGKSSTPLRMPSMRGPEVQTILTWASADDLVQRRVVVEPVAVLPWILRCLGR